MMKNILNLILLIGSGAVSFAQVLTNGTVNATITNSNVMLDGSTNFSAESGASDNVGKGIIIPSVNLVNFEFDLSLADSVTFPTYFDGMIVYNNATGTTLTAGNRSSTAIDVVPGYYFFFNPNGAKNNAVSTGVWRPFGGSGSKVNITASETTTHTLINKSQVYAVKGTFDASGSSTAVNIPSPAGMTGMYGITIYKSGTNKVYSRELYSYAIGNAAGNAITGSQSISIVYPAGTYDYVLEYLK